MDKSLLWDIAPKECMRGVARLIGQVTYFEPVPPRLGRNTVIESTFEVGRRFRCTMRIDCGELNPGAVIRPVPGESHPHMPKSLAPL